MKHLYSVWKPWVRCLCKVAPGKRLESKIDCRLYGRLHVTRCENCPAWDKVWYLQEAQSFYTRMFFQNRDKHELKLTKWTGIFAKMQANGEIEFHLGIVALVILMSIYPLPSITCRATNMLCVMMLRFIRKTQCSKTPISRIASLLS